MTLIAVLPRVGPSLVLILLSLILRILPEWSLKIILHCGRVKALGWHLLHTCELLVLSSLLHHEEHVVLLLLLHLVLVLGRVLSLKLLEVHHWWLWEIALRRGQRERLTWLVILLLGLLGQRLLRRVELLIHHRHSVWRRWEKGWWQPSSSVIRGLLEGSLDLRRKIILTRQELGLLRSVVLLNVGSVP